MKLRKILLSLLIAITTIFALNTVDIVAANTTKLVVHYQRDDANYSNWSLWLWPSGGEGSDYQFSSNDSFGRVATVTLSGTNLDGASSVGILIKDNNWSKDFEQDRFIDMTNPNANGEVHVYFRNGEEYFSYVSEDQAGCDPLNKDPYLCAVVAPVGLISSYINEDGNVEFVTSESVTNSDVTVYEEGLSVSYTGFSSGTNGELVLDNGFDITKEYSLEIAFTEGTDTKNLEINFDYDSIAFENNYGYDGWLGYEYSNVETTFKVWAPISSKVEINLFNVGHTTSQRSDGENSPYDTLDMTYLEKGVWTITIPGDLNGKYYTYNVINSGKRDDNIQDPYGVSFGLNGQRSMVLDLDATDPIGWDTDAGIDGYQNPNEAIIYELHVRDLTSASSWGGPDEYAGKYLGFTVEGTTYTHPTTGVTVSTGLDHLIELGITHVHLLPTYDQDGWNNEANFSFNWGYNPQHYNSPEGGYSTDPYDGAVRVTEYKQMVMALHDNGINVINDVVYNHVANGGGYSMNRFVPYYFSRLNNDGSWSNGSGVGNETATERYMVNKFIVDSIVYWAEEYHIDGFRFDLMAVHDYENMNNLATELEAIDPDIFVYGEPWGGGSIQISGSLQAGKQNLYRMPLIAAFNDTFRDAVKGSVWEGSDKGYVTDGWDTSTVKTGIAGATFGENSSQIVNYVSAHDNHTLYDKLIYANGYSNFAYYEEVDYQSRLASSIVLMSQGIPFLHAGSDFLRTKGGDHNSYESSDIVNQLSYVKKANYVDTFNYYKGIIEIRKEYDSFKMSDRTDINSHLTFLNPEGWGMIGYRLQKNNEDILVYHNSNVQQNDISLPSGAWKLIADRDEAGVMVDLGTYETRYPIEAAETLIFVRGNSEDVIPSPLHPPKILTVAKTIFEGGTFTLEANTNIYSYSLNGGEFISVTPSTSIELTDLTAGTYDIIIKDEFGTESDSHTLTVLESDDSLTCPDGQHEEDGKCVDDELEEPLICEDNQQEVNGECVDLPQPLVCGDNETVADGKCVPISTGCFSSISLKNSLSLIVVSFIGVVGLLILRKK